MMLIREAGLARTVRSGFHGARRDARRRVLERGIVEVVLRGLAPKD